MNGVLVVMALVVCSASALAQQVADDGLIRAVADGDSAAVHRMIARGIDVNAPDLDGSTPLLWAAHLGNRQAVALLLEARANPNAANAYGVPPLYAASRRGDAVIVERLLGAGADPNVSIQLGETPLMAAAETGSVDVAALLLKHGANVNARELTFGENALMRALDRDERAAARLLLESGADARTPSWPSDLPSRTIPRNNAGRTQERATGGLSPLMLAARQGNREGVRLLLAHGAAATIGYTNPDGVSALMIAIINGNWDIAADLLDAGAPANDGSLYEAIDMHNVGVAETLFDQSRPLRLPADEENVLGPVDIIERLLRQGADPNEVTGYALVVEGVYVGSSPSLKRSPLLRALRAHDVAAVKLLLAHGADPNRDIAAPSSADASSSKAKAASVPLVMAVLEGDVRSKFAGSASDGKGEKVYRYAARRDRVEVLRLMLDAGAALDARNPRRGGATLLQLAAEADDDAVMHLLVDKGARPDIKDNQGASALDRVPPGHWLLEKR